MHRLTGVLSELTKLEKHNEQIEQTEQSDQRDAALRSSAIYSVLASLDFFDSKLGLLWILQGSDLSKISCEQLPLPREQVRAFPCIHSRFHAASSFATPPFSNT